MNDALRLKGKVVYGELEGDLIKFDVNQLDGVSGDGVGLRVRLSDRNTFIIDPATIQLADDPRKEMLAEIRELIDHVKVNEFKGSSELACLAADAFRAHLNFRLNEMEAKL